MALSLEILLLGFAALFYACLRNFKVSVNVDNTKYAQHLKSLPSSIRNIIPILLNQLFFKYGYEAYLFNTEWGQQKILPNIVTTVGPLSIDLNHLHEYLKCIDILHNIKDNDPIPFGYFHCLCVKSLLFTLCTRREFPLKLIGSVHYKNTFKIYKCVYDKSSKLFIETTVNQNIYFTKKHDLTFSVTHKVFVVLSDDDKELICEITDIYLVRAPKKYRIKTDGKDREDVFDIDDKGEIVRNEYKWNKIAPNVSFRYSIICGDINPIHLHKYFAKLFGFRSNINHGMWSVARIIHRILDCENVQNAKAITIGTTFERPLFLPNVPSLHTIKSVDENQARFKLFDDKTKLILQGYMHNSQ